MQKIRSGLAAAAAERQLMNAPEGKSSLQSKLNEAERRAHDAELSAQDARAALARTLLEAAQVEAVVTARVKAQSEAELSALRTQLSAVKLTPSKRMSAVDGPLGSPVGERSDRTQDLAKAPDGAKAPDLDNAKVSSTESVDCAKAGASAPDGGDVEQQPERRTGIVAITTDEDVRAVPPETPDAAAIDAANSQILRFLPPIRLAFLSVTAIAAIVSYLIASTYLNGRDGQTSIAMNAVSGIAGFAAGDDRLVQGAATDSKAIAAASATLDEELERLQTLSQKIAAMRAWVAQRTASTSPAPAVADRTVSADRMASAPDASWLLFMPVERDALVQYLAGTTWPGIQVAAQEKIAAPRKN